MIVSYTHLDVYKRQTQEELNEKTVDMIGATPTYILLAAAIIILVGMYFYLNKHLPQPGTSSEVTNTQA